LIETRIEYVPVEKKTIEYEEVHHYEGIPNTVRYARKNYSDNKYLDQYPVIHKTSSYRPLYDYYHPGSTYGLWNFDYPRYKTTYINNEPIRSTYYSDHIYPSHGVSRKYL
jgi:hypothetical protein